MLFSILVTIFVSFIKDGPIYPIMTSRTCILILSLLLLFTSSCSRQESASSQVTIGVSVLTMTHPFFLKLVEELEAEAGRQGFEVLLTTAEFDVARQKDQISDFIVRGVDAILLSPADSRAIGTTIQEANDAGIPVFTADIAVLAEGVDVVSHVGIDNYVGGQMAGRAAIKALGGSGHIAIIDHPEVESVIQRTRGFISVIDSARTAGQDVEIVAQLPGRGSTDHSFRATEDALQAHAELDLVFGINDETALGAFAAIEKANKMSRVRVIGFGGKEEAIAAVDDGRLYADIITYPGQIGAIAIQSIAKYRAGETVPEVQLLPTALHINESE